MRKYKTRQVKALIDIYCDICNKRCKRDSDWIAVADADAPLTEKDFELATLSATWGYNSRKDGESYHADICENCFDKVVAHINQLRADALGQA